MLQKLRAGAAEAERTLAVLRSRLPPEIAQEVFSASIRGATLSAFVANAAWGTRLRYVAPKLLPELAQALGTPVEEIRVKVRARPRSGQAGSAELKRGQSPLAKGKK